MPSGQQPTGQHLLQEFPRNKKVKYFLGMLLIFFILLGPAWTGSAYVIELMLWFQIFV